MVSRRSDPTKYTLPEMAIYEAILEVERLDHDEVMEVLIFLDTALSKLQDYILDDSRDPPVPDEEKRSRPIRVIL